MDLSNWPELEMLLDGSATSAAWDALCDMLEQWPGHSSLETVIPDVGARLASWPDHLRRAPYAWVQRLLAGAEPRMRLARVLSLSGFVRGDAEVAAVVARAELAGLAELSLDNTGCGDQTALALAAGGPTALRLLSLRDNRIGADGFRVLAQASQLATLETLRLDENPGGQDGVMALVGSPYIQRLRALELFMTGATDAAVAALAQWPGASQIETLDLSENPLTDQAAFALAESPYLAHLRVLSVAFAHITDAGVAALAGSAGLRNVMELDLQGTKLGWAGRGNLAEAGYRSENQRWQRAAPALP